MTLRFGHRPLCSVVSLATLFGLTLTVACGGARPSYDDGTNEEVDAATPPAKTDPIVTVNTGEKLQTLEGFGAAVAWYQDWYTDHPNRAKLRNVLFSDLGLDILRLRNQYRVAGTDPDPGGLAIYKDAEQSLGHAPRVLLTSWTPPASLKANATTDCVNEDPTCTLKKDENGDYVYEAFGEYWADALEAYRAIGLDPYYISIQNEPDYTPDANSWEACRFDATESEVYPGYDRAFAAVVDSLEARGLTARLLGAETAQVSNNRVERYVAGLDQSQLYGVAHHLYGGGQWANPTSYEPAFTAIAETLKDLPRFQTEFSPTGGADPNDSGFEVAWLIHESLAVEGASAYLHWDLFWPSSGLVSVANPYDKSKWTNDDGFALNPAYYSLRHYARYTNPGDRVVQTTSNRALILATSILSADEQTLCIVLLNRANDKQSFTLDLGDFEPKQSLRVETTHEASWQTKKSIEGAKSDLTLPPRSITTLVVTLNDTLPE
jgi:glucuronoarabinoxylan endo-1,4-beta-xylanase